MPMRPRSPTSAFLIGSLLRRAQRSTWSVAYFFAPENRRKPNSRTIVIHFLRFAARASRRGGGRPPVLLLPGGPGSEFDSTDPKLQQAVERLRRTRDVVYVSQRGYAGAPGLAPDLSTLEQVSSLQEPSSAGRTKALQQAAVKSALEKWTGKGLDLGGDASWLA